MSFTSSLYASKKLLASYVGVVVEIVSVDSADAYDALETKSMYMIERGSGIEILLRSASDSGEAHDLPGIPEFVLLDVVEGVGSVFKKDMRVIGDSTTTEDLPARLDIEAVDKVSAEDLISEKEAILLEHALAEELRLSPVPISVADEASTQDQLPVARKQRMDSASFEELSLWGALARDSGYGYDYTQSIDKMVSEEVHAQEVRVSPKPFTVLDDAGVDEKAFFSYWEGTVSDQAIPEELKITRNAIHVEKAVAREIAVSIEIPTSDTAEPKETVSERGIALHEQAQHDEVRLSPVPLSVLDTASYWESQFSDRDTHVYDEAGASGESILVLYAPPIGELLNATISSAVSSTDLTCKVITSRLNVSRSVETVLSRFAQLILAESNGLGLDKRVLLRQSSYRTISQHHGINSLFRFGMKASERIGIDLRYGIQKEFADSLAKSSLVIATMRNQVQETYETSASVMRVVETSIRLSIGEELVTAVVNTVKLMVEVVNALQSIRETSSSRAGVLPVSLTSGVEYSLTRSLVRAAILTADLAEAVYLAYSATKPSVRAAVLSVDLTVPAYLAYGASMQRGRSTSLKVEVVEPVHTAYGTSRSSSALLKTGIVSPVSLAMKHLRERTAAIPKVVTDNLLIERVTGTRKVIVKTFSLSNGMYLARSYLPMRSSRIAKEIPLAAQYARRCPVAKARVISYAPKEPLCYTLIYPTTYAPTYVPMYLDLLELRSIVDRMEYVKEGDEAKAEHINVFVDFCNVALRIAKRAYALYIEKTGVVLPEVEELIAHAESVIARLSMRRALEVLSSKDHNLITQALKRIEQVLEKLREYL
ncbi:MAG: hypothetical protein J7M38_00665 [Armatimonadetes bacterium]|nr:hypothetical protein [Armatimonadota bacterium]